MRFLVDTNVFSEPTKPRPDVAVLEWLASQPGESHAVSVISVGEAHMGIELLEHGKRRTSLQQWFRLLIRDHFADRVLPVTRRVALAWGRIMAAEQKRGRKVPLLDGLLLATAAVHGLTIVTRNERDFEGRGVPVHNPWRTAE
jgi:predicted nucleic acid-binding protein